MFERKVHVEQHELAAGMIVQYGRSWVRIHHIEDAQAGSNQRKATCTLRRQTKPGAFTVWFLPRKHRVIADSLPPNFAIQPQPAPQAQDESEPETRTHVQRGVHNVIEGTVHGPTIQAGSIGGQKVTDFFKNK